MERLDGLQHMRIPAGQTYKSPGSAYVEGDASSASYFLAGATITGGTITVEARRRYVSPRSPSAFVARWQMLMARSTAL